MIRSHFIVVIACVFPGFKNERGVGDPSILATSSQDNEPCTLPRRPPNTAKSSASDFIPLYPSTILTIVSIGPGFIKVDNWSSLLAVLPHSPEVGVPLFSNAWLFVIVTPVIYFLISTDTDNVLVQLNDDLLETHLLQ